MLTEKSEAFLNVTLELGLLTARQAEECRAAHDTIAATSAHITIARVAVDKGFLTRDQVKAVTIELRKKGIHPRIGPYEILGKLGEGGSAVVYRANDTRSGATVALKVLAPALAAHGVSLQRFLRSAELAATIAHPNVVRVLEIGSDHQKHYVAMEFVEGVSLSDMVSENSPLPESEALRIARMVAEGLIACHDKGIVHRDVKPSNVIVTPSGDAKLLDLGLARDTESVEGNLTLTGQILGTPRYMSPEQCAAAKDIDIRSDIYSLGATLFLLVTGRPPFDGATVFDIMKQQSSSRLPNPRNFNRDVREETHSLIWKMMAKDRKLRFQTAREVIEAIDRANAAGMLENVYRLAEPAAEQTGAVDVTAEMQRILSQMEAEGREENLSRSVLRRVKVIDERLNDLGEFAALWQSYAECIQDSRGQIGIPPATQQKFAALQNELSGRYRKVLPLLAQSKRGGSVIRNCAEKQPLSAVAGSAETMTSLDEGIASGSKLLTDFRVFLRRARRRTISQNFLRYTVARYAGTPLGISVGVFLLLAVLFSIGALMVVGPEWDWWGKPEPSSAPTPPERSRTPSPGTQTTPPSPQTPGQAAGQSPSPAVASDLRITYPAHPTFPIILPTVKDTELPSSIDLILGNNVTMKLVLIPAGEFRMGCEESPGMIALKCRGGRPESGTFGNRGTSFRDEEYPLDLMVRIPRQFYMGVNLVTQAQYGAIMGKHTARFEGPDRPVEMVSWHDAMEFCSRLSQRSGRIVRLPTEAEWEYACRAGTTTAFNTGDTISTDQANYDGNRAYGEGSFGTFRQQTTPVGSFPPNAWGLYDMHGNVWEWCSTAYREYPYDPNDGREDPTVSGKRVLRGGSWVHAPYNARSAKRNANPSTDRVHDVGFRVVVTDELDGALHEAARTGHVDLIEGMVQAGHDVAARDARGRTPLHLSAREAHQATSKALLAAGADVNARDNEGRTPLHAISEMGSNYVPNVLLDNGADINARDNAGRSPLHLAAATGTLSVAKTLVERGAEIDARDNDGRTPLHLAAIRTTQQVTRLLLDHGADINARDNAGRTPFFLAAAQGSQTMPPILKGEGADVNAKDYSGLTPLDVALANRHDGTVKLIRNLGGVESAPPAPPE